jgi:hypothetical protein
VYTCLNALIKMYCATPEALDLNLPEAYDVFCSYIVNLYTPKDLKFTGVVRLATVHQAKGYESHTVYIAQPNLLPLQERVDKGGWEAHEELSVEYVGKSRARDIMVYLPHMERFTRDGFLALFEPPAEAVNMASDATAREWGHEKEDDGDDNPGNDDAMLKAALAALRLTSIPESTVELNKIVGALLRVQHPDRNFNTTESNDRTKLILDARAVVTKAILESMATEM